MGLDMYLVLDKGRKGTEAVEKLWESDKFWRAKLSLPEGEFDGLILAQWRKAFGILNWFDNNLESVKTQTVDEDYADRDGTQNCTYYKVGKDELVKLLLLSKRIMEEAKEDEPIIPDDLYPIGEDFFIGGYEGINKYWWYDLEQTVTMLQEAERHINWDEDDVYFYVSY